MAAKNRSKSSSQSGDRTANASAEDAARRSPRAAKAESAPASSRGSGSGALLTLVSALLYLALAAGAVLASVYVHRELTELKHTDSRHEEAARRSAAAAREVELALEQIRTMKASLEGLESVVASARTDLESTSRTVRKGEADARRMEDTLQKLQNKLFRDLAEAVRELKDGREKDMSSLEEQLAQMSGSLVELAAEQSRGKSELRQITARLEQQDGSALLTQELRSAVANLNTASEVNEGNMAVLREQIAAVDAELQTRNGEVASVSEEVGAVRTLVQSALGTLREDLSSLRASVQTASDQLQGLSDRQGQSSAALQSLGTQLRDDLLKLEQQGRDLELRLKAAEESQEVSASSLSEHTGRLSALESRHQSQEGALTGHRAAAETLRHDLEGVRSELGELRMRVDTLERTQRISHPV